MFTILNDDPVVFRGTLAIPTVDYLINYIEEDYKAYLEFFRPANHSVPSNHLLVRLLQSITVPFDTGMFSFIGRVQDVALDLSQALKLTTSQSPGQTTRNVFFPDNVEEIIIANIDDFDVLDAEGHWMELMPIKVLTHPIASVDFPRLWGIEEPSTGGVAVISINVPMLAFQYRQFCKAEEFMAVEVKHTLQQFLTAYPLANMVPSFVNVGYFNILNNYFMNGTMDNVLFKKTYARLDRSDLTFKAVAHAYRFIEDHHWTAMQLIDAIRLPLDNKTLYDALQLPNVLFTRQVIWSLVIARIPYIKFLVNINDQFGLSGFDSLRNKIKMDLRVYANEKGMVGAASGDLTRFVDAELESGIKPYL